MSWAPKTCPGDRNVRFGRGKARISVSSNIISRPLAHLQLRYPWRAEACSWAGHRSSPSVRPNRTFLHAETPFTAREPAFGSASDLRLEAENGSFRRSGHPCRRIGEKYAVSACRFLISGSAKSQKNRSKEKHGAETKSFCFLLFSDFFAVRRRAGLMGRVGCRYASATDAGTEKKLSPSNITVLYCPM